MRYCPCSLLKSSRQRFLSWYLYLADGLEMGSYLVMTLAREALHRQLIHIMVLKFLYCFPSWSCWGHARKVEN